MLSVVDRWLTEEYISVRIKHIHFKMANVYNLKDGTNVTMCVMLCPQYRLNTCVCLMAVQWYKMASILQNGSNSCDDLAFPNVTKDLHKASLRGNPET